MLTYIKNIRLYYKLEDFLGLFWNLVILSELFAKFFISWYKNTYSWVDFLIKNWIIGPYSLNDVSVKDKLNFLILSFIWLYFRKFFWIEQTLKRKLLKDYLIVNLNLLSCLNLIFYFLYNWEDKLINIGKLSILYRNFFHKIDNLLFKFINKFIFPKEWLDVIFVNFYKSLL